MPSMKQMKPVISTMSSLLLIFLSFCCALCSTEASIKTYTTMSRDCLNGSLSVWRKLRPSASLVDCFASSRSQSLGSVGVVQRNKRDASCALFRFSQVCRLLRLAEASSPSTDAHRLDCEIVVDSEFDAVTANKHFDAVWVGDRGPQLENVVCGSDGQKNPMRSSNVMWTSEGARMDGVSSRLWVDDPSGLDFTGSYTWAIQLKRAPKTNCFIELAQKVDGKTHEDHFWEYSVMAGVKQSLYLSPGYPKDFQTGSVLPADSEQFVTVGAVFDRTAGKCKFFFGSEFLPTPPIEENEPNSFNQSGACIRVGWRSFNRGFLNGVIRAVAVSHSLLPAEVIRQLF